MTHVTGRLSRRTAAALCALLIGAAACARRETLDLTARFAAAEVQRETARIDFGTAAARPHLASGWGIDEMWGDASFVWALGDASSLDFFVATPQPITLRMRCWPMPLAALPPQTVAILLDGTPQGALTLQSGQAEYSIDLPAAALRAGVNTLDLRYGYARRPVDLDPTTLDPRPLAVAWDWIAFDGLTEAAAPAARSGAAGEELVLPAHSQASFYADLSPGSVLAVDDVAPLDGRGDAPRGAALDVLIEPVSGAAAQTRRVPIPDVAGPQQWALDGSGPSRLTFRPGADTPGVRIVAPRVSAAPHIAAPVCDAGEWPPRDAPQPPVVVYLIDTLRADHLGCYGYAQPITPRIDAFAREAVRFANAIGQSSWTKPSVASIFTGLTPHRHGANGRHDLMRPATTLAGALAAAGYDTMGIITNSTVAADFGLDQGFADYRLLEEQALTAERSVDALPGSLIHQGADALRRAALAWLDARRAGRPFFLYLHASDPHDPYIPPDAFRRRFAPDVDPSLGLAGTLQQILSGRRAVSEHERDGLVALYDAEIAFVDQEFGALLDDLRMRGVYDDALIILIGDHGESFADHGRWHHGTTLFQEQIHVPLLIKFPRQWHGGSVATGVAQHVDIFPTILAALGLAAPAHSDGRSLLPALACAATLPGAAPAYSYLGGDGFGTEIESVLVGDRKLIHYVRTDRPHRSVELYDLRADPAEQRDLAAEQPLEAGYLLSLMAPFRVSAPAVPPPALDPAVAERLRALGYGR